jgi:hypothetical protein
MPASRPGRSRPAAPPRSWRPREVAAPRQPRAARKPSPPGGGTSPHRRKAMQLAGNDGQSRRPVPRTRLRAVGTRPPTRGSRENPVDDYVETHGAAGHRTPGRTTSHHAGHLSRTGRGRPAIPPCPQQPRPAPVTTRNIRPGYHASQPDQPHRNIHARQLDNLPPTMVPAETFCAIACSGSCYGSWPGRAQAQPASVRPTACALT